MRVIRYYILHAGKNSIKRLLKSPIGAILCICLCILMVSMFFSIKEKTEKRQTVSVEILQQQDADNAREVEVLLVIASVVLFLYFTYQIGSGQKKGTYIFQMPDVNLLFSAPLKPQTNLMLRLISKMGGSLAAALYMIFQLPNLIANMGMPVAGALGLLFNYFLMLVMGMLCSVLTYCLCGQFDILKKVIRPIIYIVLGLVGVVYIVQVLIIGKSPADAGIWLFNSKWFYGVPFAGWIKGLSAGFLENKVSYIAIFGAIILFSSILMVVLIFTIKTDFYEDAMSGAQKIQEAVNASKEGRQTAVERKHSKKVNRTMEMKSGFGANTFYYKAVMTHLRGKKLGLFNGSSTFFYVLCIGISLFSTYILKRDLFLLFNIVLLFVSFFYSAGSSISYELSNNFMFLIPESAFKKAAYNCFADMQNYLYDTALPYVIACVIFGKDMATILAGYFLMISFFYLFNQVGAWIDMICPSTIGLQLRAFVLLLLRIVAVIPVLIVFLLGKVLWSTMVGIILCDFLFVGFGTLFLRLSSLLIHKGRD